MTAPRSVHLQSRVAGSHSRPDPSGRRTGETGKSEWASACYAVITAASRIDPVLHPGSAFLFPVLSLACRSFLCSYGTLHRDGNTT